jgi:hypothetical protein
VGVVNPCANPAGQLVRWYHAVYTEGPNGRITTEMAPSMTWGSATVRRRVQYLRDKDAFRAPEDKRRCWIIVGRWTLEAGWNYARLDVDLRRPRGRRSPYPGLRAV